MVKTINIYSENSTYQQLDSLKRNRTKRQKLKMIFAEGRKPIEIAVKNHWKVDSFIYVKEDLKSDWVKDLLKSSIAGFHYEIAHDLMAKLSDKEEVSELIAILDMPADNPSKIKFENKLVVILDRPASPGNLGTMIRSCEALNADGVIVIGHAADIYDSQTIRASLGSLFSLPVIRLPSHKEVVEFIDKLKAKESKLQVLGTSAKAQVLIYNQDFTKPTVLLLGNETNGLSQNYKDICDNLIKIPISGSVSSLNVACAGTVFLYEVERQRKS